MRWFDHLLVLFLLLQTVLWFDFAKYSKRNILIFRYFIEGVESDKAQKNQFLALGTLMA